MYCKDCEFLRGNNTPIKALDGRKFSCTKFNFGITLKEKEDIENLKCIK